jgi:hypothetical protein
MTAALPDSAPNPIPAGQEAPKRLFVAEELDSKSRVKGQVACTPFGWPADELRDCGEL